MAWNSAGSIPSVRRKPISRNSSALLLRRQIVVLDQRMAFALDDDQPQIGLWLSRHAGERVLLPSARFDILEPPLEDHVLPWKTMCSLGRPCACVDQRAS